MLAPPWLSNAELAALLAACPVDLTIVDEHGFDRDGDRMYLGLAARGMLPGGDSVTARLSREAAGLRIVWQYLAARAGAEFCITAPPHSRISRWLHRREIIGAHHLQGSPAVRAALAEQVASLPAGCELLRADLVRLRGQPGADLVTIFRAAEAPAAVAACQRFAHGLYTRFVPAA